MIALMYHDVIEPGAEDSSGFPGRDAARYKVSAATFEAHLAALDRAAQKVRDRRRSSEPAADPMIITFDDGGVRALYAADSLERHGRRGHFFITTNYIGDSRFLGPADLRDLHRRGHVIGTHSCSHPLRMGRCPDAQLLSEWTISRARLAEILGADVAVGSVPGGDYTPRVADAACAAGLKLLFTSEPVAVRTRRGLLEVRGRFTIQRTTPASTVAALAAGAWLPRAQQAAVWTAKKFAKRVGGAGYLHVRRLLLGHGDEVQWGDAVDRGN